MSEKLGFGGDARRVWHPSWMHSFGLKPWEMNRFRSYELDAIEAYIRSQESGS